MNDELPIQESLARKKEWLEWANELWPRGSRCRVIEVDSDEVSHYLGQQGTVVGADLGIDGDYPGMLVRLDDGTIDTFYVDGADPEVERLPDL